MRRVSGPRSRPRARSGATMRRAGRSVGPAASPRRAGRRPRVRGSPGGVARSRWCRSRRGWVPRDRRGARGAPPPRASRPAPRRRRRGAASPRSARTRSLMSVTKTPTATTSPSWRTGYQLGEPGVVASGVGGRRRDDLQVVQRLARLEDAPERPGHAPRPRPAASPRAGAGPTRASAERPPIPASSSFTRTNRISGSRRPNPSGAQVMIVSSSSGDSRSSQASCGSPAGRSSITPSGRRFADHLDAVRDQRELEHLADRPPRLDHHDDAPPVGLGARRGVEDHAQPRRVDVDDVAQVDDEGRRPPLIDRRQGEGQLAAVGEVEVAAHRHHAARAVGADVERSGVARVRHPSSVPRTPRCQPPLSPSPQRVTVTDRGPPRSRCSQR